MGNVNLSRYIYARVFYISIMTTYTVMYTHIVRASNLRSLDITSRVRAVRNRGRVNPGNREGWKLCPIMSQRRLNARRRHICLQSLAEGWKRCREVEGEEGAGSEPRFIAICLTTFDRGKIV